MSFSRDYTKNMSPACAAGGFLGFLISLGCESLARPYIKSNAEAIPAAIAIIFGGTLLGCAAGGSLMYARNRLFQPAIQTPIPAQELLELDDPYEELTEQRSMNQL